ncbi:MAG: DUF4374 domain-containing protein [Myxococcota bacterium]
MRCCLLLLCLIPLVACGDDDSAPPDGSVDAAGSDAPTDADSDVGGDSAFLVATRIRTPDGRTVFLNVVQDLSAQTIDTSTAFELPGVSRVRVYDGKVFAFDGETGNVIRFSVGDDLTLSEEARFSMSGLGIVRFRSQIIFVSSTRAYYLDIPTTQAVAFNPSTMELVSDFPAPDLRRDGFDATGGELQQVGDEIFAPVSFANTATGDIVPSVVTVVFAANEDQVLRTIDDSRCGVVGGTFTDGDFYYAVGDWGAGVYDAYAPTPLPPPCVVRASAGATAFEPDFSLDLEAATGRRLISDGVGLGDGTFLVRVFDAEIDLSMVDPFAYFGLEAWRYAVVNIREATAEVAEGLPLSGISFAPLIVDGAYYGQVVDEETSTTTLHRINADGTTVESLSGNGELQLVARVR